MGDDQRRAPGAQNLQRLLHRVLGFGIERRGRFVEQDDRRVLEKRAGDGDALALAAGKLHAVLAARAVVALGEAHDEVVGVGRLGRGLDLVARGAGPAEGDVVGDRALEQERLLADVGEVAAQRSAPDLADVLAVDQHRAGLGLVEAQDQVHRRRLAAAGAPDQRRRPARLGDEVEAAQHRLALAIGEAHVAELDPPGARPRARARRRARSPGSARRGRRRASRRRAATRSGRSACARPAWPARRRASAR